ncbi:MAG: hypothetical protein M3209_09195 [Acidobacteriota bacterium]|nr:hypothetical protein [Acidobacteriota bacterium]
MKNLFGKILFSKNPAVGLAVCSLIFAGFVLACGLGGGSADRKPIPEAYLGTWTGQDGTVLTIRADGTGDYNAGSSKVDGAAVEVDEAAKEIRFTMLGVGVGTYKIDAPPSGNQMKIDGQTFRRGGSAPTNTSTVQTTNSSTTRPTNTTTDDNSAEDAQRSAQDPDLPDSSELQTLVKTTLLDFNSGVQSGSFESFHSSTSSYFQQQFTPARLEQQFGEFIRRKIDISNIADKQANFKPSFEDQNGIKILNINGSYPTTPTVSFELQYIQEDIEWKLLSINVRTR